MGLIFFRSPIFPSKSKFNNFPTYSKQCFLQLADWGTLQVVPIGLYLRWRHQIPTSVMTRALSWCGLGGMVEKTGSVDGSPHHSPWIRHSSCYFHDFILFLPESPRIPQWIFQKIPESVQDFWQTERDWYTLQYVHIAKIWKPYRRPAEGLSGCLVGRPPALVLLCRQRGV